MANCQAPRLSGDCARLRDGRDRLEQDRERGRGARTDFCTPYPLAERLRS